MTNNTPAGWYPGKDGLQYYWDGQRWSGERARAVQHVEYVREDPVSPQAGYGARHVPSSHGRKEMAVAYILAILGGGLGFHRFYLRRYVTAVVLMLTGAAGVVSATVGAVLVSLSPVTPAESSAAASAVVVVTVLALLPCAAAFVWVVSDLFRIPGMTREENGYR